MRGFWSTTISKIEWSERPVTLTVSMTVALILALTVGSCSYQVQKQIRAPEQNILNEKSTIGINTVEAVVFSVCMDCHSGARPPNLSSHSGITGHISEIQDSILSNKMPPQKEGYRPLSACQKDLLNAWVALGMPDTSDLRVFSISSCQQQGIPTDSADQPILEQPLNYATLHEKILKPRCIKCHNVDGDDPDAAELPVFPYSALIANRRWMDLPIEKNRLYKMITRTDDKRMPPPDDGAPPLSPEQIEFIKRWLEANHPE